MLLQFALLIDTIDETRGGGGGIRGTPPFRCIFLLIALDGARNNETITRANGGGRVENGEGEIRGGKTVK